MNYYQYPPFPGYPYPNGGVPQQPGYYPQTNGEPEQTYIENILRLNLGKHVSVYMNFEQSQWGSKIFKGILEASGKDHIIVSDTTNQTKYLLLNIYLNYVTFEDEINYYYPYQTAQQPR